MSAPGILYLDSSAIVKLVVAEPESASLFNLLETGGPAIASSVAKMEVLRAVRRSQGSQSTRKRVDQVLERIALIKVDEAILNQAARLEPVDLRSLDAIHLATALSVQQYLEAFVVFDRRLAEAAERAGLRVVSPS